jgi:hypothetical protein
MSTKPVRFKTINSVLLRFKFGLVLTIQIQNKVVFAAFTTSEIFQTESKNRYKET